MRIWLKKNDVCLNKQMQIRYSENLEVTNSVIARTNRIAKARLKFGSNDARKHLQRQKERITMKTTSRASWKRKSGRVQPIDSRNNENLEATNNMSARTNRIAYARLKFDSTILSLSWSVKPNVVDKADSLNHHHP